MKPVLGKLTLTVPALMLLAACASPVGKNNTADAINSAMDAVVAESTKAGKSEAVNKALLPPLSVSMPEVDNKPVEARFDLAVNNTAAQQVFTAIVSGTRYSILIPSDVSGNMSLNLKDVTVLEALEAIRETYGYDYKVDGTRIYIQPISMQTRIYQVSYLTGQIGRASCRERV